MKTDGEIASMDTNISHSLKKRNSALICICHAKIEAWVHCHLFVRTIAALKPKSMRFETQVAESRKKSFNKAYTLRFPVFHAANCRNASFPTCICENSIATCAFAHFATKIAHWCTFSNF